MSDDAPTYEVHSHLALQSPKRRAFVAVLEGASAVSVPLSPAAPVTIGRSRSCTIHVDDGSVSRLQATVTWDGESVVTVEDHGSKNGTHIGTTRVEGKAIVPSGATIQVGPARLAVVLSKEHVAAAAPRTGPKRSFVSEDPATEALVQVLGRAAQKSATVLLLGETGSGKEVMARWVHDASPRANAPFVALNCGSLPESLAESTLFGHERGAFTGANAKHLGVFEQANKGTLFLDEIGELSASSQVRLLRVLEEHRVTRLGSTTSVPVDVRVVAATHRDLHREVAEGRFREDLLYRLDVVRVRVPSLRERPDDVVPLAEHFLASFESGSNHRFTPEALSALARFAWPGNVRQLRNAVQRAVALASDEWITVDNLGIDAGSSPAIEKPKVSVAPSASVDLQSRVEESELEAIRAALDACGGNQTHAAKRLGIARRTLINKLEKYGLKPAPVGRSGDDDE